VLANCETVKLWTQATDSKGSTVSQFHSFTKRHGGWGRETIGGVGQKQGPRDQGNKGNWSRKRGPGEALGEGVGRKTGGVGAEGMGGGVRKQGTSHPSDEDLSPGAPAGNKGPREQGSKGAREEVDE